jgi:hypothetical protein
LTIPDAASATAGLAESGHEVDQGGYGSICSATEYIMVVASTTWFPHTSLTTPTPTQRALLALALGGFGIGTGEFVTLGLLPNVAASLHVSISRAGELILPMHWGWSSERRC